MQHILCSNVLHGPNIFDNMTAPPKKGIFIGEVYPKPNTPTPHVAFGRYLPIPIGYLLTTNSVFASWKKREHIASHEIDSLQHQHKQKHFISQMEANVHRKPNTPKPVAPVHLPVPTSFLTFVVSSKCLARSPGVTQHPCNVSPSKCLKLPSRRAPKS